MTRELEEILRQQIAQPAGSCKSQSEVSFLNQVISPLYDIIAAVRAVSRHSFCVFFYFFLVHFKNAYTLFSRQCKVVVFLNDQTTMECRLS